MITGTAAEPAAGLITQIAGCLGAGQDWAPALASLTVGEVSLHLAVMTEPFLGWLLDGAKTIESRFSRVRCAPYGILAEGDVVVVKRAGGAIAGAFQAGPVSSYRLTPAVLVGLRDRFAAQIHALDDEFWDQRAGCAYATLAEVRNVRPLPALTFPKKDRRGWVQLTRPAARQRLP